MHSVGAETVNKSISRWSNEQHRHKENKNQYAYSNSNYDEDQVFPDLHFYFALQGLEAGGSIDQAGSQCRINQHKSY